MSRIIWVILSLNLKYSKDFISLFQLILKLTRYPLMLIQLIFWCNNNNLFTDHKNNCQAISGYQILNVNPIELTIIIYNITKCLNLYAQTGKASYPEMAMFEKFELELVQH